MTGVLESFETRRWATLASSRIVAKLIRDEFSFCTQVSDTLRGMYSKLSRLCYFNQTFAWRCTSTDIATCRSIKLLKAECCSSGRHHWFVMNKDSSKNQRTQRSSLAVRGWITTELRTDTCNGFNDIDTSQVCYMRNGPWVRAWISTPQNQRNDVWSMLCRLESWGPWTLYFWSRRWWGLWCTLQSGRLSWKQCLSLVSLVRVLWPLCLSIYDVSGRSTSASILSSGLPNCLWCDSEGCLKLRYQVGCYILGSTIQWFLMCSDSHSQHKHGEVWGDAIQVSTISTLY